MEFEGIDLSGNKIEGEVAEGDFAATIISADLKETKDRTGLRLALVVETDGGVRISDNLNVVNKNPVAENIARDRLKGILHHCGLPTEKLKYFKVLEGQRLTVRVKKDTAPDGRDWPRIVKYLSKAAPKGVGEPQLEPPAAGLGNTDDIPF